MLTPTHYERCYSDLLPFLKEIRARYTFPDKAVPWEVLDKLFAPIVLTGKGSTTSSEMGDRQAACLFVACEIVAKRHNYDPYKLLIAEENREIEAWVMTTYNRMLGKDPFSQDLLGDARSMLAKTYHMLIHVHTGKHVFTVSPGLADNLRDTELRGLSTDDIRLPYDALYIQVPKEAELYLANIGANTKPSVEGIYVSYGGTEFDDEDSTRGLDIVAVCFPYETHALDVVARFGIPLKTGEQIDTVLERMRLHYIKRAEESPELGFAGMAEYWLDIFHWLLNVIVYATWPDAEAQPVYANKEFEVLYNRRNKTNKTSRRKKINVQLQGMEPRRRVVLGESIRIIDRAKQSDRTASQTDGVASRVRGKVKGYWQRYHVGKGRTRTIWNWINPRDAKDDENASTTHKLK